MGQVGTTGLSGGPKNLPVLTLARDIAWNLVWTVASRRVPGSEPAGPVCGQRQP